MKIFPFLVEVSTVDFYKTNTTVINFFQAILFFKT